MDANENKKATEESKAPKAGWRIKTGIAIFIASIAWPVLLPVLWLLGLSAQYIAAFTGAMVVAAEVMIIAAAAISGKKGFAYIKQRIFGVIKSYGPPQVVSAARYKTGLVMFTLPLLYGFLSPYIDKYLPGMTDYRLVYAVVGDIFLLVGLFLLGGDFWGKLRALFIHNAVVKIPDKPVES